MNEARGVVLALLVSLGLHVGVVVTLRSLGLGPLDSREAAPPLYVDLVEPLVAVSGAPRPGAAASARVATPRRAEAPSPPAASGGVASSPAEPPTPASSSVPPPPPPRPTAEATTPPAPPSAPATVPATSRPAAPATVPEAPPASVPAPSGAMPRAEVGRDDGSPSRATTVGNAPAPPSLAGEGGERRAGLEVLAGAGSAAPASPGTGGERGVAPSGGHGAGDVAALGAGRGAGVPPEYDAYVRALRWRIQERLEYPALAVRRGLQGTVELEVQLGVDGRLAALLAVGGDAAELLREAAIRAVRDAAPFPFPPGLTPRSLRIRLPVRFELQ